MVPEFLKNYPLYDMAVVSKMREMGYMVNSHALPYSMFRDSFLERYDIAMTLTDLEKALVTVSFPNGSGIHNYILSNNSEGVIDDIVDRYMECYRVHEEEINMLNLDGSMLEYLAHIYPPTYGTVVGERSSIYSSFAYIYVRTGMTVRELIFNYAVNDMEKLSILELDLSSLSTFKLTHYDLCVELFEYGDRYAILAENTGLFHVPKAQVCGTPKRFHLIEYGDQSHYTVYAIDKQSSITGTLYIGQVLSDVLKYCYRRDDEVRSI